MKKLFLLVLNLLVLSGMLHAQNSQVTEWETKAKAGDVEAQYNLGAHYWNNKNYEQAVHWFELAAKAGNVEAQYHLGFYYMSNEEYDQGLPWIEKAAEQNHPGAQYNLGVHYFNNKNYTNAFPWFLKSAKKGDKEAMKMLAMCYRKGLGVKQDAALAEKWEAKAKQL